MLQHIRTHQQPAARGAVGSAVRHARLPGARFGGALNAKLPLVISVTALQAGH